MKPAPFDYSRPSTVAEAVRLLGELGTDGKVLAGGQSLLPILSMRLASPHHLVDINRIAELSYIRVADAMVRVGALARHAEVERDPAARTAQPLLAQALRLVAHPTIRNRGTTVGSIVHADPSGEMTAVLSVLGGSVRLASASGERTVAAADFFLGPLESAIEPGELAIEAAFPVLGPGGGTAFVEVARRHGDYAVCGVAALVQVTAGEVVGARAAYISMSATPIVLDFGADIDAAAERARTELDPEPDIHASADYRRHLAGVLTDRALRQAVENATGRAVAA
jgi:aerobic carbon-monoxide dehydrogenase medium subunit